MPRLALLGLGPVINVLGITVTELTCFKAYDIRGEIGIDIDEAVAYRVGRAVAQHFGASAIVIGFDARATSPAFARAAARFSHGRCCRGADLSGQGADRDFGQITAGNVILRSQKRADRQFRRHEVAVDGAGPGALGDEWSQAGTFCRVDAEGGD